MHSLDCRQLVPGGASGPFNDDWVFSSYVTAFDSLVEQSTVSALAIRTDSLSIVYSVGNRIALSHVGSILAQESQRLRSLAGKCLGLSVLVYCVLLHHLIFRSWA